MKALLKPCSCDRHSMAPPQRKLTVLLLNCWQRKFDRRPYRALLLNRKHFEETYNRQMNANDFDVLLQFLSENDNVQTLELNYMPLPSQINLQSLALALARLRHVILCHVSLPADALKWLSVVTTTECKIESLRLNGNEISQKHATFLRDFLLKCQSIVYLDVGHCGLNHTSWAIVADGILNCPNLQAIDVSGIQPCHSHHVTDIAKITLTLSIVMWQNRLCEVHCKHCGLDGHDILSIADALEHCTRLVYLDLGSNRIGAYGIEAIFKAQLRAPHLIGLDVSNNQLGDSGGYIVAHNLPSTRLRYLDIGRNGIGAEVMQLILCTIKKPHQMRILNVTGNHFDYEVGEVLKRLSDAKVLLLHSIDVTTTYDSDEQGFRVVPVVNERAEYNYRYHRVVPFHRRYDSAPNLRWHDSESRRLLVNGMFIDPIFVDMTGNTFTMDAKGNFTRPEGTKLDNFE